MRTLLLCCSEAGVLGRSSASTSQWNWNCPDYFVKTVKDRMGQRSSPGLKAVALYGTSPAPTLAQSHLHQSSLAAGAAENNKVAKYGNLTSTYNFAPFAIKTLGGWGPGALSLSSELGNRIAAKTGYSRSTSFLRQRLDVVVQRGNAASVRGTMSGAEYSSEKDFVN